MSVSETLQRVKKQALADEGFRRSLLDTRGENGGLVKFCKLCTEAGFPLSAMDMINEGDEFYAAIRRATNGGGENSPLLEGEDDFYEMFLVEIDV